MNKLTIALGAALAACAAVQKPPDQSKPPEVPVSQCKPYNLEEGLPDPREFLDREILEVLEDNLQPIQYIKKAIAELVGKAAQASQAGDLKQAFATLSYAKMKIDERLAEVRMKMSEDEKRNLWETKGRIVAMRGIQPSDVPLLTPAFVNPDQHVQDTLEDLEHHVSIIMISVRSSSILQYLSECPGSTRDIEISDKAWKACGGKRDFSLPDVPEQDILVEPEVRKIFDRGTFASQEELKRAVNILHEKAGGCGDLRTAYAYYAYGIRKLEVIPQSESELYNAVRLALLEFKIQMLKMRVYSSKERLKILKCVILESANQNP